MKKSTQLLITYIVAFIVSGVFTIIWFTSDTQLYSIPFFLALGMAVVFETFKINSGVMAFTSNWINGTTKVVLTVISALIVFFSILASTGYLLNYSNNAYNEQVKQSTAYQEAVNKQKTSEKIYSDANSEINRLQKEKTESLSELKMQLNEPMSKIAYKDWNQKAKMEQEFVKSKEKIRSQIQDAEQRYEDMIVAEKTRQNNASTSLLSDVDTSNMQVKFTKGSLAVSGFIGNFFGESAETIELTLKVLASILFEIIAWVSAILVPIARKNEGYSPSKNIGKSIGFKNKTAPITVKKIGFDTKNAKPHVLSESHDSHNFHDMNIFFDCMKKNSINNIVQKGYLKIGKEIGFNNGKSRSAYENLKAQKKIKAEGGKTIII